MGNYTERFTAYFERDVAQKAAHSLSDGVRMGFHICEAHSNSTVLESFTFFREAGLNRVIAAPSPQGALLKSEIDFHLPKASAELLLKDSTEEIAQIGIAVVKLILTTDRERRISVRLGAGFITLLRKGYFGVLTSGGSELASFLARNGLSGMNGIKAALKKMTGEV